MQGVIRHRVGHGSLLGGTGGTPASRCDGRHGQQDRQWGRLPSVVRKILLRKSSLPKPGDKQGREDLSIWLQAISSLVPPTFPEHPKPFPTTEEPRRLQNCFPKLFEKQWVHFCWFVDKHWVCSSCPRIQLCHGWNNPGVTLARKLVSCRGKHEIWGVRRTWGP